MTMTCIIAGISAALACALFGTGFFRLAINLDAPQLCWSCLAIGATELIAGVWIWGGLLVVMGGYL